MSKISDESMTPFISLIVTQGAAFRMRLQIPRPFVKTGVVRYRSRPAQRFQPFSGNGVMATSPYE